MPLFSYTCNECGGTFEELHKADEEYCDGCPLCASLCVSKTITTANFQFNGVGFYETDLKKKT